MNTKETALARLSAGLKHEALAYRIVGIVGLVSSIILIIIGIVSMGMGTYITATETDTYMVASDNYEYNYDSYEIEFDESDATVVAGVAVIAFGGFYLGFGAALLVIAIVNLVMASKASKRRHSEVLTIKHASSVSSIVVAALFNEIALIFVIINFVFAKRNRALLSE